MSVANSSFCYRVINLGGKSLYIEGIKSVVSLENEQILFQIKGQVLEILGKDMKVKYLDKTTCVIEGEILSVGVK